ncbi:unnamed protein product [Merluccius merluccius]
MEVREEMLEILEKVWTKLQGLPEANSLELGAFFILILFVEGTIEKHMAANSVTAPPAGDWMERIARRFSSEPWALGGGAVMAVFVLGVVALAAFAFLYGCCCTPRGARKKSRNAVL